MIKEIEEKIAKEKSRKEIEQHVLEEIRNFDFGLLKYFDKENACHIFLKKLQEKLKSIETQK